jgi:hypothetical protein
VQQAWCSKHVVVARNYSACRADGHVGVPVAVRRFIHVKQRQDDCCIAAPASPCCRARQGSHCVVRSYTGAQQTQGVHRCVLKLLSVHVVQCVFQRAVTNSCASSLACVASCTMYLTLLVAMTTPIQMLRRQSSDFCDVQESQRTLRTHGLTACTSCATARSSHAVGTANIVDYGARCGCTERFCLKSLTASLVRSGPLLECKVQCVFVAERGNCPRMKL